MKVTMVIPSYWGRERAAGWQPGDAIYDHPTPLDEEGTLGPALESIKVLDDKDFDLVVIAVSAAWQIQDAVEDKVRDIIEAHHPGVPTLLFGPSALAHVHELLFEHGREHYLDLLQLAGYSNVRNLCLAVPQILGSEVAVLIDDDELFDDPSFMAKAKDHIGRVREGRPVCAVAGYYLQPDGGYRLSKVPRPWMTYWNQYEKMNEAFDLIIGRGPRLKPTPFVFGGNMVLHRDLFTAVPFDPLVPRGEDIDFLINARMFGFTFFLDNELSITHRPPPKTHPTWRQLREDVFRFVYERQKIRMQKPLAGMTTVRPEDFDPYPGCFLRDDLEEKIEGASRLLAEDYRQQGDLGGSEESLSTITLVRTDAVPARDPFQQLCEMQPRWKEMMEFVGRDAVREALQEGISPSS